MPLRFMDNLMHLSSYKYSIATVVTTKAIEAMLEAGTEGNYKDDHPWLIAKELFEHAGSINQALPIMFACKDPDKESVFSHWSTISNVSVVELHRGKWESRVQFGQLAQFNPIWSNIDSVILKTSQEQMDREEREGIRVHRTMLDEHHIHPYAICETPAFIEGALLSPSEAEKR